MNAAPTVPPRLSVVLLFVTAAVVGLRLWSALCFIPLSGWNAVRLAPSFMLRFGTSPYPGLEGGPTTTWIYGPVPLFLDLPATLAHHTAAALLIAGTINLLIAVIPAALLLFAVAPPGADATAGDRSWGLLLCLALWPNSSLQYLQPDNPALAFGLLSNLLLLRPRPDPSRPPFLAALSVSLAVWSKQTTLGLILAQLLWLGATAGRPAVIRHVIACLGFGLALGSAFVGWFGWDGLWLNLVRLPGRLPYWDSMLDRTLGLLPHLAGYVVLPAVAVLWCWRRMRRNPAWLLPVLSWLCLLPTSLLSIYKIGGTANSLSGFLYLLPVTALSVMILLRTRWPRPTQALMAFAVTATVVVQLALSPARPLRPVTAPLARAEYLAHEFPGQIYFPWNPIVTFFSDHRFYHAEDGLYVRYTAQLAPTRASALRDLPPHWCITAFQGPSSWGIVKNLQPSSAQVAQFGEWTLYSWPLPVESNEKR